MAQVDSGKAFGYLVGEDLRRAAAGARLLPLVVGCRSLLGRDEVESVLRGPVDRLDSIATARDLALVAYFEGMTLGAGIGFGLCAGPNWLYLGVQTRHSTISYEVLNRDKRPARKGHAFLSRVFVELVHNRVPNRHDCIRRETMAPKGWESLLHDEVKVVHCAGSDDAPIEVIFGGSFNPFHKGHARLAEIAHEITGRPVSLEMSISNVEKPPLHYHAIAERLEGLERWRAPYHGHTVLTRGATFVEKARTISHGLTFVVGMDTLLRIGDPRFYGDARSMEATLTELRKDHDCSFLAFPRATKDGRVLGHDEFLTLPLLLREMAHLVKPEMVQEVLHLSSSDIRRRGEK